MKIFSDNVDKVNSEALNREKKNISKQNNKSSKIQGDKVEISTEALDIKKMENRVNLLSDINIDKVNKVKNQLDKGKYKISSQKIADRIIEEETFDTYV